MTRVVKAATTVTCNRCNYEDNWVPETPEYIKWEWSEFSQGEKVDGHKKITMDLCPKCTREIKNWIRNGR